MLPFYSFNEILSRITLDNLVNDLEQKLKNPAIRNMTIPEKNLIHVNSPHSMFISMPALSQELGLYINKVGTFFERSHQDKLPSIHAVVIAYSSINGEPLAILDGQALTNLKCAAITAVVTNHCATLNSTNLAIIGAGAQARQQVNGVCLVRDIKKLYLYNRSKNRLSKFIDEIRSQQPSLQIIETNSISECICDADIIGTTTSSATPIHSFDKLKPSIHINCMGLHTTESREIPVCVLEKSQLIVEDVATAIREAGKIHANALDIFNMLATKPNTLQKSQTIFSSTGFALLDLITTAYIINQFK